MSWPHRCFQSWCRLTSSPKIRQYDPNAALAANGAITRASSSYATTYASSGVVNGERSGLGWGQNGGWNDGTASVFPDWVEVEFYGTETLDQIDVFTLQDLYSSPSTPTPTMTFTQRSASAASKRSIGAATPGSLFPVAP